MEKVAEAAAAGSALAEIWRRRKTHKDQLVLPMAFAVGQPAGQLS